MTKRYELSQGQWERIAHLLPGKADDPGLHAADNRLFVHGVLWILRSGARWSDLPARYGKDKSVHKRFSRWAHAGVWEKVFAALIANPSNDYVMLDASLVKAHQQAATGKGGGGKNQALGRSRGGLTTKIHLLCDALGRPLRLRLTPGPAAEVQRAPALRAGVRAAGVIANKGDDANALRAQIVAAGMQVLIPSKRNRKVPTAHDRTLYRTRNRIERCFNKLKHFRRIATRLDRRDLHFLSFLHLASALLWLK